MSRHRLEPPARVRPRYRRIGTAALSLGVTLVALLGGMGVIPVQHRPPAVAETLAGSSTATGDTNGATTPVPAGQSLQSKATAGSTGAADSTETGGSSGSGDSTGTSGSTGTDPAMRRAGTALPAETGTGRRVVFDMSDQRVWLVGSDGEVASTYLVSGSLTHNLRPGSYAVYSRSRWAVGVDDSGVMQYFVRFTRGQHAAIGFHSIPTKLGRPLQSRAQLGTPQSHGCIRQALPDAVRMWDFAPVGTRVVVTA